MFGDTYRLSFFMAGPGLVFPDPRAVRVEVDTRAFVFEQAASSEDNVIWGEKVLEFAALGRSTTLTFSSPNADPFWGAFLDDVSVEATQPVPEPATATLCLVGLAGVGRLLSRRRTAGNGTPQR